MTPKIKAEELINAHGKVVANKVVDGILTEIQENWNQSRIDFWLDVKNELQKS